MRIAIRHELRFAIAPGTAHAVQHLLLFPRETPAQKILEWEVLIPGIEQGARYDDAFGNAAVCVSQTRPESETLFVAVSGVVETVETSGVLGRLANDPIPGLFRRATPLTRANGSLVNRVRAQERGGATPLEALHWLMKTLNEAQTATPEPAADAPADADDFALEIVAEDHAHVFVAVARGLDLPARFVTGYVLEPQSPGPARLHAWAEVFVDDTLGWVGFDASANLCPTAQYVRLAAALDAESARPIRSVPDYAPDGPETLDVTLVSDDMAAPEPAADGRQAQSQSR